MKILLMLSIFMTGVLMSQVYYEHEDNNFYEVEQYQPKYIMYSDSEMLSVCDEYDLVYNFEEGICNEN